jgi:hypothetical protein
MDFFFTIEKTHAAPFDAITEPTINFHSFTDTLKFPQMTGLGSTQRRYWIDTITGSNWVAVPTGIFSTNSRPNGQYKVKAEWDNNGILDVNNQFTTTTIERINSSYINTLPPTPIFSQINNATNSLIICSNNNTLKTKIQNPTGTISATLDGIAVPYNALDSSFNYSAGAVGTHTLLVTYTNSVGTGSNDTIFTTIALPTISIASIPATATICQGQSTTLTATGASTYSWSGGITNGVAFTPSTTTTYTVTGTSSTGCTATNTKTITVNNLPTITITSNPINAIICAGQSATLSATGASTYSWSGGITNGVAFTPTVTTTYTVTGNVTSTGCVNTATKTIIVNNLPTITITSNPANAIICAGQNATLTASGASSYVWSGGITNGVAFTPSSTTTYTVTGTASNSCVNTATKTITVNALPTLTITPSIAAACAGNSITLIASGASTYSWSGGIINGVAFTPSTSTTYTVTATGTNNCTTTATKLVSVGNTSTSSVTQSICQGQSYLGYTTAGTYIDTLINSIGCDSIRTLTLTVNALSTINITTTPNDTVCAGTPITITAIGANTYSWSGGITNGIAFTPTANASYTVTATATNGCIKTQVQNIVVNALPTINITTTPNDTVCAGTPITITASGANTYSWSGGITNGTAFTPTANATYTVTATATNGCTKTQVQSIVVNALPTINIVSTPNDTVCAGTAITITANGSNTYSWSGGITNGTAFTPTTNASYTVTATAINGCTKTQVQNIVVNALPTINITTTPNDTVCAGTPITITASGANTYSWSVGITNGTAFTPTANATYTVTATAINGCTKTQVQSVVVNPSITPTISITANPVQGATGDPITYTAITNVPLPYSIEWYRNTALSFTGTTNTWSTTIQPNTNAVYAVIKSPSQCLSPDSAKSNQLEVLNITSINGILPHGFLLYPNPTEHILNIEGLKYGDEFVIYDALGKVVLSSKANNTTQQVDVSNFASGNYQIIFSRKQQQWSVKFIKK